MNIARSGRDAEFVECLKNTDIETELSGVGCTYVGPKDCLQWAPNGTKRIAIHTITCRVLQLLWKPSRRESSAVMCYVASL